MKSTSFVEKGADIITASHPSSQDISCKLVSLICDALIIFLNFSVIDRLPVGGVAVRSKPKTS